MRNLLDTQYIYRLSLVETQINDDRQQMTTEKPIVYLTLFGVQVLAWLIWLFGLPKRVACSIARGFLWLFDWNEIRQDWQAIKFSLFGPDFRMGIGVPIG